MPKDNDYKQKLIDVARVTRVMAGGRRFRFRTVVVIGDREGKVAVGVAKGKDIPQAVNKAVRQAKKNIVEVDVSRPTIPLEIESKFKSARVLMKPASEGKGLVAGGVVRAICDLAGIENISAKIISRTNNKLNIARATIAGFRKINRLEQLEAD